MRTERPRPTTSALEADRQRILAEHRELRQTVDEAVATRALVELVPRLAHLRELLSRHFEDEEAATGLHDAIAEADPRLAARLRPLSQEHTTFLADLDGMIAKGESGGPVAEVRRELRDLAERLHEHEEVENELLSKPLYTDLGSGD